MDIEKLKQRLIEHEGLRLKVYTCTRGRLTIGVGRNLEDRGISEQEALMLLSNDIEECIEGVEQLFACFDGLSDSRQRVLVDMRFNLGQAGLEGFRMFRNAVENGDFDRAADEMLDSNWARQVGLQTSTERVSAVRTCADKNSLMPFHC